MDLTEEVKDAEEWWNKYSKKLVSPRLGLCIGLEQDAKRLWIYEKDLVPGLLQLRSYTTGLLAQFSGLKPVEQQAKVDIRQLRQRILGRTEPSPPRLTTVIAEAALKNQVCPHDDMALQMHHLANMASLDYVRVQVLPQAAVDTLEPIGASFTTLTLPAPEPLTVYRETATGGALYEDPYNTRTYLSLQGRITEAALSPDQSIKIVRQLAHRWAS